MSSSERDWSFNGKKKGVNKAYLQGERQLDPARALRYEAADEGEVGSGAERRLRRCRRSGRGSRNRDGEGGEEEEEGGEERQRVRRHGEEWKGSIGKEREIGEEGTLSVPFFCRRFGGASSSLSFLRRSYFLSVYSLFFILLKLVIYIFTRVMYMSTYQDINWFFKLIYVYINLKSFNSQ